MPNWCWNYVTIEHPDKEFIDKIEAVVNNKDDDAAGLLQTFYPMPDENKDSDLDWYWWRTTNWGTKWDVTMTDVDRGGDNSITLIFDSAWSPPVGFYDHFAEEYGATIEAEFEESGMGFIGYWNNEEGEETWEYYDIFEKHGDRWSEHVPERFHEMLEANYESWKEWREDEDIPNPETDKSVS